MGPKNAESIRIFTGQAGSGMADSTVPVNGARIIGRDRAQ